MKEESPSLERGKKLPSSMDYDFLRKKAISLTQQISGDKWTDYNVHDPGITILEQFCFALTDIAYRTNLDIETILFHEGDREKIVASHALFAPEQIFPTGPITLDDYRILILDKFPNKISNCWVDKVADHRDGIQGLYNISILPKNDLLKDEYPQLQTDIQAFAVSNRNLCEDFNEVRFLQPIRVSISADIDIRANANAEDVLAEVLFVVEDYFNPRVKFHSLEELKDGGMALEDIFDTPSFEHGFILKKYLRPKEQEFYVSKIANYILEVKGVRDLRNLSISVDGLPLYGDIVEVTSDKYLTLGFLGDHFTDSLFEGFALSLFKGGALSSYTEEGVIYALELKEAKTYRSYPIKTEPKKQKTGIYRTNELLSYESVQKTFPGIYGVGDYTPANEEGKERRAQSDQLKAYLILFDQIMANHLAQLTKIAEILTIHELDGENIKTYYSQSLAPNTAGATELIKRKLRTRQELLSRLSILEQYDMNLTHQEIQEIESLKDELIEKELLVRSEVSEEFNRLLDLSDQAIKRTGKFKNRAIILEIQEYKKMMADLEKDKDQTEHIEGEGISPGQIAMKVNEIQQWMIDEWMETEHSVEFKSGDFDKLMMHHDLAIERKNRMLTHYLARFGEQFTNDFQIKFSTLLEGENEDNINRKLLSLKSSFLKEIVNLNRHRARGFDYSDNSLSAKNIIPLKRKISYLLNIEHLGLERLTSAELKGKLVAKRLSGKEILKVDQADGKSFIKTSQASDKITFLVNGSNYYRHLFKYGLTKRNYSITSEENQFVVYFKATKQDNRIRLFGLGTKSEAVKKIESLIQFLKLLNAKFEGFHIIEHILLRPKEGIECHYFIKGKAGSVLFKSKEAKAPDIQLKNATDMLLLACYSTNYRLLQNLNKEFVVVVKNQIGKELAKAPDTFMTEMGAKNFIDQCINYFNDQKQVENFSKLIELDNDRKFHFILLNDRRQIFIQSLEMADLSTQEEDAKDLLITGMYSMKYIIKTEADDHFAVYLLDTRNIEKARSKENFSNREKAEEFIRKSITYFENLKDDKSIIQFRRMNGRSADEYNSQLSIIYPDWTARFSNQEFLQLFNQTIFKCAPAYLKINVIGLNYAEMSAFEESYFEYLKELPNQTMDNRNSLGKLSHNLLDILLKKVS